MSNKGMSYILLNKPNSVFHIRLKNAFYVLQNNLISRSNYS